jgi:hypothetical protein
VNLYYSREIDVDRACIITIKNNDVSEKLSKRCQLSCERVGMQYQVWDAFDGHAGLAVPEHSRNSDILNMIKVTDHYLTRTEVACFLSHLSLWIHCCLIDKPLVILEHDAVMVQKFTRHAALNSLIYLGCSEWQSGAMPLNEIPVFGSEGPNYLFVCRAHAYSLDPLMAKNLISHAIKMGIYTSLDKYLRADLFNITHTGLYAFDSDDVSTIKNRPSDGRSSVRNDDLSL